MTVRVCTLQWPVLVVALVVVSGCGGTINGFASGDSLTFTKS